MSEQQQKPKQKNQQSKKKKATQNSVRGPKEKQQQQKERPKKQQKVQNELKVSKIPGLHITPVGTQLVGSNTVVLPTQMQVENLYIALYTYASRILFANQLGSTIDIAQEMSVYQQFFQGLAYLGLGIYDIAVGETVTINQMPRIFEVLTAILSQKTVKLGRNFFKYTPTWDQSFNLNRRYDTPTGAVFSLVEPSTAPTTSITAGVIAPDPDSYQIFIRNSELKGVWGSYSVDWSTRKPSLYDKDPSAYARNYPYYGVGGTGTTGLYSNTELEVRYSYPLFSKFVRYDNADKVVARIYTPQAGGMSTVIGLSVTQEDFNYSLLKNPYPVKYKFIDFMQVYSTVCAWLVSVWDHQPTSLQSPNIYGTPEPFTFSSRDFFLMLRQAVLTQFPEQIHGQFIAPVLSTPSSTNSVFQPFIVDSIGMPQNQCAQMVLPQWLIENLSMLKGCHFQVPQTNNSDKNNTIPKKLRHNWVPVWGVYSGDELPIYSYTDPNTGSPVGLFSDTDVIPTCRFYDLISDSVSNAKSNINNYVPGLIMAYNNKVSAFAQNKSSIIAPINTDVKCKTSLLSFTRVQESYPEDFLTAAPLKQFENPANNYIINKPGAQDKKKKKAIPPATQFSIYTKNILSLVPLSTEVTGALRYYVLPTIRFDYTSGDKITEANYIVYTGEGSNLSNTQQGVAAYTPPEIFRTFQAGELMATGYAPGSTTTNLLTLASETIARFSGGSDFLSTLMGGVTSLIPIVGPLLGGLF